MPTISEPSTFKNTPKLFGARNFYKRPAGAAQAIYFQQLAALRPQAVRPAPGLPLLAEKPDFTRADQEWIAQLAARQLDWEDW